ncbi:MAG TPA: hypothetical protein VMS88_01790, partial [Terriglobales bacterium]|nr:hypothetical protein [Terriglobales bacterium]
MRRQRPHLVPILFPPALALLLTAALVPHATAAGDLVAAVAAARTAPARRPAISDSARQAYRAWIRRLRARDSTARADSIRRARGLAPSVPRPARAPAGPPSPARERAAVASQGRGAAPTAPPARSLPIAASSAAPGSAGVLPSVAAPESAGAVAPGAPREPSRAAPSLGLHDEPVSPADSAAYMARIRSDFTPLNRAYATTREALGFIDTLYGILVALFILFTRLSAWMRDVARRCGARRYVHTLVYFALYLVVSFLLGFPLALYEGFAVEHQYALSTQSFGGWFGQELIALGVGIFLFGVVPLVRLAYAAFARWPRRWWVALGVASLPV